MKTKPELPVRLREARQLSGLSQAQVAEKIGVHRPTISEIEAGRRSVAAEELPKLAQLYGVSVGWLLGEESSPNEEGDALLMAARELGKIREEDLDRLLRVIRMVRGSRE